MQNLDIQLQRTLNMDDFDMSETIRRRRKEIDEVVAKKLVGTTCNLSVREEHGVQQSILCSCQIATFPLVCITDWGPAPASSLCPYHLVVS